MQGVRTERIAEEIRLIVGEMLVRQEIKDHAVRDAGLITISHVKVTGDLQIARVSFTVYGAAEPKLREVAAGLNRAAGFIRGRLRKRLNMKIIPTVEFGIDRVYDSEARMDQIFDSLQRERAAAPAASTDDPPKDSSSDE
jgi:ribosome-binding factor A